MTREDIIRMAREAGMLAPQYRDHAEHLERFAALVASAEREACAKVCDDETSHESGYLAYLIRARSKP